MAKLENEFNPFEELWSNIGGQKIDIVEQNGKNTVIKIKANQIDYTKITLIPKNDAPNQGNKT